MLCCVDWHIAMLCCVALCCVDWHIVVLCFVLCRLVHCCVVLCCVDWHIVVLCPLAHCCVVSTGTLLCCGVLCYVVSTGTLCCVVLCCVDWHIAMLCCVDWHIVIDIPKTPTAFTFRIKQTVAGLLDPADEGGIESRQLDVSADLNPQQQRCEHLKSRQKRAVLPSGL